MPKFNVKWNSERLLSLSAMATNALQRLIEEGPTMKACTNPFKMNDGSFGETPMSQSDWME